MKPRGAPALYAITGGLAPALLCERVALALEAGVRWIQVREKGLEPRLLLPLVSDLVAAARRFDARILVNDRADVAIAAGAAGVHLGEASLPSGAVRAAFPGLIIGVSVHDIHRAVQAAREGADFVLFGPVHATPSKRAFGPPRGLRRLGEVVSAVPVPVVAVGGIGPDEVQGCLAAGAHGVAAIRGLLGEDDVKAAVARFLDALAARPAGPISGG